MSESYRMNLRGFIIAHGISLILPVTFEYGKLYGEKTFETAIPAGHPQYCMPSISGIEGSDITELIGYGIKPVEHTDNRYRVTVWAKRKREASPLQELKIHVMGLVLERIEDHNS